MPDSAVQTFKSCFKRFSQRAKRHCFGYCCSCFLLWINFGSHSSMFWPKGLQWWMKWEMARNQYIVIMVMVVLASSALIELRPLIFKKRKQKAILKWYVQSVPIQFLKVGKYFQQPSKSISIIFNTQSTVKKVKDWDGTPCRCLQHSKT